MDEGKIVRLKLTEEEAEIIEPIIERLNGLDELHMIIPFHEVDVIKNVEKEITELELAEKELVGKFCKMRHTTLPSESINSIYCDLMDMTVMVEFS